VKGRKAADTEDSDFLSCLMKQTYKQMPEGISGKTVQSL